MAVDLSVLREEMKPHKNDLLEKDLKDDVPSGQELYELVQKINVDKKSRVGRPKKKPNLAHERTNNILTTA